MLLNNLFHLLDKKKQLLEKKVDILNSCSYERWIEKGFAIIRNSKKNLVKSIDQISLKEEVDIKLKDGEFIANIKQIRKE